MSEPIRSRDLAGRALDLAVARAEGACLHRRVAGAPFAARKWPVEGRAHDAPGRLPPVAGLGGGGADHRTRADQHMLRLARLAGAQRARPLAELFGNGR